MARSGTLGQILVLMCGMAGPGCAGSRSETAPAPALEATAGCPAPVVAGAASRFGWVFIDKRLVAENVAVRRTSEFPETYELVEAEPAPLAALPIDEIDLVQFLRGSEAERDYGVCPTTVAILFTTKRG